MFILILSESKDPAALVQAASLTPKEWMPKSKKEWATYKVAMAGLISYNGVTGDEKTLHREQSKKELSEVIKTLKRAPARHPVLTDLVRSTGGKWDRVVSTFKENPPSGIDDLTSAVCRRVVIPAAINAAKKKGIPLKDLDVQAIMEGQRNPDGTTIDGVQDIVKQRAIIGNRSANNVMESVSSWHRARARLNEELMDPDLTKNPESITWAPLTPPQNIGKMQIRILTSERELMDHGIEMDHCVGGYAENCLDKSIVGVIRQNDRAISTFELLENEGEGQKFRLAQHFGYGNSQPDIERPGTTDAKEFLAARKVLEEYMKGIENGRIPTDSRGLDESRQKTLHRFSKTYEDRVLRIIGYNPDTPGKIEASFEAYKEFMNPKMRGKHLQEWLDETGLTKTINQHIELAGLTKEKQTIPIQEPPPPPSIVDGIERLNQHIARNGGER